MRIGVLALQGDFEEHLNILDTIGIENIQVRLPKDLKKINGLIIPGGESTTIGKLAVEYDLIDNIRDFCRTGAIWGTCAGAIFLSKNVHRDQPLLDLMNISIERNAFGRQVESFETNIDVSGIQNFDKPHVPFHAIFIRAPLIEAVNGESFSLSHLPDGRIVAARQGNLLATSFHPELTGDFRFHKYFVSMANHTIGTR